MAISYKDSGVDVTRGYDAVARYKGHAGRTAIKGLLTGLGSFNGMFEVPKGLKEPVMVSGTDGVGTKLDLAFALRRYDSVGIDCVAMSVNDILCSGVQSLFFLDYIACGLLDANIAEQLVKGVADGCVEAGCALLGGETAEMPGFYDEGKYDLAGFAVGVAEKSAIITGSLVKSGDELVGLSSTGLHSNGFSLVRKLVTNFSEPYCDDCGSYKTIGEALLTPTRIYVKPVMNLLQNFSSKIHGLSHITGGGFIENIPRMFGAQNFDALIKRGSWRVLPIFSELIKRGADEATVYNTFNMGLGLVLAVEKGSAKSIVEWINEQSFNGEVYKKLALPSIKAYTIGEVVNGKKQVVIE